MTGRHRSFHSLHRVSAGVALLATALATQISSTNAADMVRHELRDDFGFEQPVTAWTMSAPADWTVKGGVQWAGRPECPLDQWKVHFMATAPDGKQWVEMLPGGAWGWTSLYDSNPALAQQGFAGCAALRLLDIESFARQYIPMIRRGATIESMRRREDIAEKIRTSADDMQLQPGATARFEAIEVRVSYQANGETVNELLIPSTMFLEQPAPDLYGGMTARTLFAITVGTITTATVGGPADENILNLIGDTVEMDPQYEQRLIPHLNNKTQLALQALQRRQQAQQATLAAMRARNSARTSTWKVDTTGSEILDIQKGSYDKITAMQDAGQANTVNMIHERQPWQTTTGSTIYMPQEYQAVYQLPNQVYAGTNDPFFNPLQTFGQFGEQLQPQTGQ